MSSKELYQINTHSLSKSDKQIQVQIYKPEKKLESTKKTFKQQIQENEEKRKISFE